MKKLVVLPIFIMMMSFSQCNKDTFDKEPPVAFTKTFYQDWVGGRPGSSGVVITLITNSYDTAITFDSIYFHQNAVRLATQKNNNQITLTANLIKEVPKDRDLILSSDPKQEFGNKLPKKTLKIPFELAKDEAVVSYILKGKKRYFKVTNIKKEKTLYLQ